MKALLKSSLLVLGGILIGGLLSSVRKQASEAPHAAHFSPSVTQQSGINPKTSGIAGSDSVPSPNSLSDLVGVAKQAAMAANAELADREFGEKLAKLVTSKGPVEQQVEAAAMKDMLTPRRFAEFYHAYAKLVRLHPGDMVINTLLSSMGVKYGREALDAVLVKHPQGFERWDSLIQGWASVQPAGATDWFNDLDENHPRYESALSGLMWGLTENDATMAAGVMATLAPADQQKAIYGFSSSFVHNHGLHAFDEWLTTTDAPFAKKALVAATDLARYQPPQDLVPWFAGHVADLGIRRELRDGFAQWFKASPQASAEWLMSVNPASGEASELSQALTAAVDAQDKSRFLSDHPNHPAAVWLSSLRASPP